MNPLLLKVFHKLPPFARNWAASMHGYSLKKWRYSPATQEYAREALVRDGWSLEEWRRWREERLQYVLHRAATQVPYYRQMWSERRRRGEPGSPENLADWPVLKKETVRLQAERFVAEDCDRNQMYLEHTSGTTGTPLALWWGRETVQRWFGIYEARVRHWNGLTHETRWGHVGGQPVVAFDQQDPPFWVWNAPLRQLYLSCMHLGPKSNPAYLQAIQEYRLEYLLGYASSLAMLAQTAVEQGIKIPLKVAITDSEPLLAHQRRVMEQAFGCPARETYGMAEIACAGSECSAGAMHQWPEAGLVELLDENDQPVAPGATGRIVATSFLNADMPFVRYDTRDLAQAEPDDQPCACGRHLPRFRKLLGRNDDAVVTKDGRHIVQIDRIFDPCFDLREAQIVQDAVGKFRIRIVPGTQWTAADEAPLCEALRQLVGEAEIKVEVVAEIERTWAGKYRMVVSHLKPTPGGPTG